MVGCVRVCVCARAARVVFFSLFFCSARMVPWPPPPYTHAPHLCRICLVGVSETHALLQDFDPQRFESLKWMLTNTGMRDMGFDFEDVGLPDKVQHFILRLMDTAVPAVD